MREVLSEKKVKAGYVVLTEKIWGEIGTPEKKAQAITRVSAYTTGGLHIGTPEEAYDICVKRGIKPELAGLLSFTCSVGFCEKEQKWYGWTRQNFRGFGIGSKCTKEDAFYSEQRGEWIAQTLAESREMACDFVEAVSVFAED